MKQNIILIFILLFLIWNLITLLLMRVDKNKAKKHKERVPEKTLFLCSFLLGGAGTLLGMILYRHKTKHWSFLILVPLSIVINVLEIFLLYRYLLPWFLR